MTYGQGYENLNTNNLHNRLNNKLTTFTSRFSNLESFKIVVGHLHSLGGGGGRSFLRWDNGKP